MSKNRKILENEIESKRKSLDSYKHYINPRPDEDISVLEAKISDKKEELKTYYWFSSGKGSLETEISKLQKRIKDLKLLEERERELEQLEQQLFDTPGQGWGGYPGTLDNKIVQEYKAKFLTLSVPLTPEVPFINIIMIGETGSGKSSFLRTFTTALMSNTDIKDNYRVGPKEGREASVTKRIHLEPMYIGDKGQQLPCRFYDVPGIEQKETLTDVELQDLQEIIDGKMILDVDVHSDSDKQSESQGASSLVEAHCILYVIHSKTDLKRNKPPSLEAMTKLKKSRNAEDGIRQFVVITAIDQLGVPNDDMKNAYSYRCVREYCEKVSVEFGLDLLHVIPVSNYFEEVASNDAKNAMSLFNLWRVFKSGKEYIERRWNRKETRYFKKSKKWTSE